MRRLKILAVQVCLAVVLLEAGLRLFQPIPFRVRGDRIVLPVRQVYTFDNHGATKLDPVTHHTKNALGFRGPDPPRDFASRLTILTIGGSTTECLFLSDGKTWTDVMARRVAALTPRSWVNNAGLDGQSTFGHLVLLRTVVAPMKPTMAVFLVGANDVGVEAANTYDSALAPSASGLYAVETFLIAHSEIASLVQNLYRAGRARQRGFGHSQVDLATAPRLVLDPPVVDAALRKYRAPLDGYAARIKAIVTLSRDSGIEPVLVTQPALFGEAVDPATGVDLATVQVNGRGNGSLEWRVLEMYNDVTRRVAGEERADLIDLARELPKDSRFFYDFLHFTNEGADRVGNIVSAHLEQWLRERGPVGSQAWSREITTAGTTGTDNSTGR
jgi:lysophospholipase L1-like esterase